jgi:hypothetical protein
MAPPMSSTDQGGGKRRGVMASKCLINNRRGVELPSLVSATRCMFRTTHIVGYPYRLAPAIWMWLGPFF